MTIQVGHLYRHGNIDYSIVSATNPVLFEPKDYGVVPFPSIAMAPIKVINLHGFI